MPPLPRHRHSRIGWTLPWRSSRRAARSSSQAWRGWLVRRKRADQSIVADSVAEQTGARTAAQRLQAAEILQKKENAKLVQLVRSSGPEIPCERYADGALGTLPYGVTRASDLIPRVMCTECQATILGAYTYCQSCKHPAYRGPPVPRTAGAPVTIVESELQERAAEVLEALAGKAGQQRKCRVADNFDGFLPARTSNKRGWMTATDVDVFEWLSWLHSHGNGTKLVHAVTRPGLGLDSSEQCRQEGKRTKRYAAASLDEGQISKLKCAMIEQLGEHSDWDSVEQRGNPVASPLVRGYLSNAQEEQRRGGVSVKQPPPLVASQLRELVRHMRRSVPTLPTAAERFAMVRDVAIVCVAFHTMKRGFELYIAVAAQVLQMSGGKGFIFDFLFGKTLRESSQAVVVRKKSDCREICAVAAMVEYRQAAASMEWALAEGSGFMFPSVRDNVEKGNKALTPAQMTSNIQTHLRAAGMDDKRYTLHSFKVGEAAGPRHGRHGHGRPHGVRRVEVCGRCEQICGGDGIGSDVK